MREQNAEWQINMVYQEKGIMSCLYDSLAAALLLAHKSGNKCISAGELRRQLAEAFETGNVVVSGVDAREWQKWDTNESASDYAQRLKDPSQWGGALEIAAFVHLFSVSVSVHVTRGMSSGDASTTPIVHFPSANESAPTYHITWSGGHYVVSHVSS